MGKLRKPDLEELEALLVRVGEGREVRGERSGESVMFRMGCFQSGWSEQHDDVITMSLCIHPFPT